MLWLMEFDLAIGEFLEAGGQVLTIIGVVILFMWLLILERFFFFFNSHRQNKKLVLTTWAERSERLSWNAEQIRIALVSRTSAKLNQHLPLINTMVALCPLLGLLGTVTGMIEVFDGMAISGGGNARTMASGVSKATIPTMAGMVGALSGVFAVTYLKRKAKRETELLTDKLALDH